MQNNVTTISGAKTYFVENNLIKDIYLRKNQKTFQNKKFDKNQRKGSYEQNNKHYEQNKTNRNNYDRKASGQYRNFTYEPRGSFQNRHVGAGQYRNEGPVPMEVENVNMNGNFHAPPPDPNYQ